MADIPLDGVQLEAQLRLGVASGSRFFSNEADLARYAEIVLRHLGGWTAEDHPRPALEMLQANALPPCKRLGNFERWARSGNKTHAA